MYICFCTIILRLTDPILILFSAECFSDLGGFSFILPDLKEMEVVKKIEGFFYIYQKCFMVDQFSFITGMVFV